MKFLNILIKKNFLLNKDVFDFEKNVSMYFGLKYAVGVGSGTDALIISLKTIGVEVGDEVVVPALSFYSTAGAATWIGVTPVFVDIEIDTFNINPLLIEEKITQKTKAIIIAHLNGIVMDIRPIVEIAKKYNIFLIEDYAQSFGSFFIGKNREVLYGDIVCLSLSAMKVFHGGGDGGAILTNNKNFYDKIKLIRMYGTTVDKLGLSHGIQGVSSRLSVWSAVILNLNFNYLKQTLERRREKFFKYLKLLECLNGGLVLPTIARNNSLIVNGYRFVILTKKRDELFMFLKKNNVDVKINYGEILPLMPVFSYLKHVAGEFVISERIARESLTLPTDDSTTEKEIDRVVKLIKSFLEIK